MACFLKCHRTSLPLLPWVPCGLKACLYYTESLPYSQDMPEIKIRVSVLWQRSTVPTKSHIYPEFYFHAEMKKSWSNDLRKSHKFNHQTYKGMAHPHEMKPSVSWMTHKYYDFISLGAQPQWPPSMWVLQVPSTDEPGVYGLLRAPSSSSKAEPRHLFLNCTKLKNEEMDLPFDQVPFPLMHLMGGRNLGQNTCDQRMAGVQWPTEGCNRSPDPVPILQPTDHHTQGCSKRMA